MKRALLVTAALATVIGAVHAQTRPDFSGRWRLVGDKSLLPTARGAVRVEVLGKEFTAKHDLEALVVMIPYERPVTQVFRLDGTETTFSYYSRGGPREAILTTRWEGETLVLITSEKDSGPESASVEYRLRLAADGSLNVEAPWGLARALVKSVYERAR